MKYLLLVHIFFTISFNIIADTPLLESYSHADIEKKILDSNAQNIQAFPEEIFEIQKFLDRYFDLLKLKCAGDFTSFTIDEKGEDAEVRTKLNKEERKVCYTELKAFKSKMITLIFQKKKEFIDSVHKVRIEELEKSKNKLIFNIDSNPAKDKL